MDRIIRHYYGVGKSNIIVMFSDTQITFETVKGLDIKGRERFRRVSLRAIKKSQGKKIKRIGRGKFKGFEVFGEVKDIRLLYSKAYQVLGAKDAKFIEGCFNKSLAMIQHMPFTVKGRYADALKESLIKDGFKPKSVRWFSV